LLYVLNLANKAFLPQLVLSELSSVPLGLPKLTFQVIRSAIATLAQHLGSVKDVQGPASAYARAHDDRQLHASNPKGVASTLNSINSELRRKESTGKGSMSSDERAEEEVAHFSSGRESKSKAEREVA
jgi:hypothetical protein